MKNKLFKEEQQEIMLAKIWGFTDRTIIKNFSVKEAQRFVQVRCEFLIPNINKELLKSILNFVKVKYEFQTQLNNLKLELFKQGKNI